MIVAQIAHRRHAKQLRVTPEALWSGDGETPTTFRILAEALLSVEASNTYDPLDVYHAIRFASQDSDEGMQRAVEMMQEAVRLEAGPHAKPSDYTATKEQARELLGAGARLALLRGAGIITDEPPTAA